jgi:hypothetical protein
VAVPVPVLGLFGSKPAAQTQELTTKGVSKQEIPVLPFSALFGKRAPSEAVAEEGEEEEEEDEVVVAQRPTSPFAAFFGKPATAQDAGTAEEQEGVAVATPPVQV